MDLKGLHKSIRRKHEKTNQSTRVLKNCQYVTGFREAVSVTVNNNSGTKNHLRASQYTRHVLCIGPIGP